MGEVKRYFIHTTDLRNINDDWFHNVEMSSKNLWDSGQVVELVHKEDYEKLKAQLERAEEVIEHYKSYCVPQWVEVPGMNGMRGVQEIWLAREYLKEKEKK